MLDGANVPAWKHLSNGVQFFTLWTLQWIDGFTIEKQRMSDDNLEHIKPPASKESATDAAPTSGNGKSRPLFGRLNQDLKDALNSWETLSEEMGTKLSPEEEQLQEVKRLLSDLKSKLSEFED